jgi:cellulose synthase/poly-beta-1,6-N-acetylglucosamine synthase-like glycosyltransferase
MEYVFWVSIAGIGYVYFGYPLIISALARLVGRHPRKAPFAPGDWPSISIVVAARNEAARLPSRVSNLLELDYPGRREIIVVSDGSSDATPAVLAPFGDAVRLIEVPRGGKPLALNAGVAAARGEILVFADARQWFAPAAIRELIANFSDPQVGGATGELLFEKRQDSRSTVGEGVGLYWRYEKWQRRNESKLRSTLGVTGAIYALRRSLWQPLPADTLLDDVIAPMRAVLAGHRVVFDDRALAYDRVADDAAAESRRKTRTLAGNYQILAHEPRLLLPVVNPVWFQYASHKIGRLVVPWALIALAVSSVALAGRGWIYLIALAIQIVFYAMAVAGGLMERSATREAAQSRRPAFEEAR